MTEFQRYAVFYAPRAGGLADLAGHWLGRHVQTGAPVAQPDIAGLPGPIAQLTAEPRRYGFHGTLRAPFRPGPGVTLDDIGDNVAALAARLAVVRCNGLQLEDLQGFLALTPLGCEAALQDLAAVIVEATNPLRARLNAAEMARRRPEGLTARQRVLLDLWGYPYVMEVFRFHLTLTDRLAPEHAAPVMAAAGMHFAQVMAQPFYLEDLCLFGEDAAGLFRLIHRYALTG